MDRYLIKRAKVAETTQQSQLVQSSDSESDEVDEKSTKAKRKFRIEWLDKYTWLRDRDGSAYCYACERHLLNHASKLQRHEKRTSHIANINKKRNQVKLDTFCADEKSDFQMQVRQAELMLVMFVISHNLPFMLMDYLPHLLVASCPDSKIAQSIHCARTKSTQLAETLGNKAREKIVADLRASKFSLIVDETTDLTSKKCLVLVVRYFDRIACTIRDRFLSLIELNKTDAESIYKAIVSFFQEHNVPLSNLIGLATDGASTMAGELSGLQARFRDNTNLFFIKCTCHSLHLCSSYACKKLPSEVETLCRNIYNFFSHSPKRIGELKEFQECCNVKPHKILGISFTRWLALESVIARIIEQWEPLELYFLSSSMEVNGVRAGELAQSMADDKTKAYLLFLSYILKIINNLNKEFQSEKARLPFLYSQLEVNFKLILGNFMQTNVIKNITSLDNFNFRNEQNFVPLKDVFIGSKAEQFLASNTFSESERTTVKKNILNFYIEFLSQLHKRFDFGRNEIKNLSILTPNMVLSDEDISIMPLINDFEHLIQCDVDEITTQWNLLRLTNNNLKSDMDVCAFWERVSSYKNGMEEASFKELSNFAFTLLCLPHSSAAAERKFFEISLVKTKLRNKLEFNTVNHIMLAKELCLKSEHPHYVWSAKDFK